jgi:hypothetical protein
MTDFEDSNIMKKVKEMSKDIENISFKYLTGGVLFEPDFLVVVGGTKQVHLSGGYQDRAKCECFYGGEKMECAEVLSDSQKDVQDEYFERGKKSGAKIAIRDVYTGCPIRKLAQIVSRAYWQGKEAGQK